MLGVKQKLEVRSISLGRGLAIHFLLVQIGLDLTRPPGV